mmetsp:Transcript_14709/g.31779  ORF Transcript_14709/g.31779 Transcript_14709/m.31779 type:complete len:261 (+) Transcript_14709:2537-3319(+)
MTNFSGRGSPSSSSFSSASAANFAISPVFFCICSILRRLAAGIIASSGILYSTVTGKCFAFNPPFSRVRTLPLRLVKVKRSASTSWIPASSNFASSIASIDLGSLAKKMIDRVFFSSCWVFFSLSTAFSSGDRLRPRASSRNFLRSSPSLPPPPPPPDLCSSFLGRSVLPSSFSSPSSALASSRNCLKSSPMAAAEATLPLPSPALPWSPAPLGGPSRSKRRSAPEASQSSRILAPRLPITRGTRARGTSTQASTSASSL